MCWLARARARAHERSGGSAVRCEFLPPGANSGADIALARGVTVAVRREKRIATRRGMLTPRNPRPLVRAMFRKSPRRGSRLERLETRVASDATVRMDMEADARHSRDGDRC